MRLSAVTKPENLSHFCIIFHNSIISPLTQVDVWFETRADMLQSAQFGAGPCAEYILLI